MATQNCQRNMLASDNLWARPIKLLRNPIINIIKKAQSNVTVTSISHVVLVPINSLTVCALELIGYADGLPHILQKACPFLPNYQGLNQVISPFCLWRWQAQSKAHQRCFQHMISFQIYWSSASRWLLSTLIIVL